MGMTRHAQIAQHPTLARLTDTAATFTQGDTVSITIPRVSWVAMGRPVNLQAILTPEGAPTSEDPSRPSPFVAPDPETQEALEHRRGVVCKLSGRYPTWAEDAQYIAGMLGTVNAPIEPGADL